MSLRRQMVMSTIDLSDGDKEMLRNVLEKHLTQLTWEIAFTHSTDSIRFLRKRKEFIEGFIQRLNG